MGFLGFISANAKFQSAVIKFGPNSDEAKAAYDECVKQDKKEAERLSKPYLEKALENERKKTEKKIIAELPEEQRDAAREEAKAQGRIRDIEREMDKGNLIFNTKDNIEELGNKNVFSLMDIQMQEAGSSWSKLGSILSMDSGTQLMAAMLKANSDENKIMIRQNEIIIRLLKQIQSQNLLFSRNSSQAEADHEDAL